MFKVAMLCVITCLVTFVFFFIGQSSIQVEEDDYDGEGPQATRTTKKRKKKNIENLKEGANK